MSDAESSPAIADMDGDGDLEVVTGSNDGGVYAWHANGSPVAGWPQFTGDWVTSSPAVGDIDGDGMPEVVVGSWDFNVYAWHANGTPVSGWPKTTGENVWSSPALGDLDGDGKLEVVIASGDGNVYAWRGSGASLTGWPRSTGAWENNTPVLVDLDGDGKLEVVFASYGGYVYVWRANGASQPGWPQMMTNSSDGSAAVGDVDADGALEVMASTDDGQIYLWRANGALMNGWPQSLGDSVWASAVLGDLDADGQMEVVALGGYHPTTSEYYGEVHAWRADGTVVTGWPQDTSLTGYVNANPVLGDLDGDGKPEVVAGSYSGSVYAWNDDGTMVPGWPQIAPDGVGSTPAIADLDGDGKLEVVAGCYDYGVYAWKCDASTSDLTPWPTFRQGLRRAAAYEPPAPVGDFSGTPTMGFPPLSVQFSDQSLYVPDEWTWTFGDNGTANTKNPSHSFAKVGTYPVSLTASNDAGSDSLTKQHYILVTFTDVPFAPAPGYWALHQILACVDAGIVQGYNETTYAPTAPVSRDQMAVYIARAMSGGDALVPTGPETATFADVPNTGYGESGTEPYWAYRHIEYCVAHDVVRGYSPTEYRPTDIVTRDQMAVFVARAKGWVGIDDNMATAPQLFPDVPAGQWAGTAIQACVQHEVVFGYENGNYGPGDAVNRDTMAVYVQRAFQLSM